MEPLDYLTGLALVMVAFSGGGVVMRLYVLGGQPRTALVIFLLEAYVILGILAAIRSRRLSTPYW